MGEPEAVIRVENVSKRYVIGHKSGDRPESLRELLGAGPRRLARALFGRTAPAPTGAAPTPTREEFWALRDVSFEVKRGEVIGLIGRNGAGKSTLLKILSRITEPTSGRIELDGRIASLLEVGTGFHAELTGRENIYLNGSVLGMTRQEINRKFDEIVAFAEVEKFLDTPVKRYSSGMYVRLAFGIAAHLDPEILIVDEVLAVGDTEFQKKCLGKIGDAAQSGKTVLVVSHNMAQIANLCTTAVWLEGGTVREIGESRAITTSYLGNHAITSETYIDLGQKPRDADVGTKARIIGLEWLTPLPLRFGQPLRVALTIAAGAPVSDAAVGFGFSFLDGKRFCTIESDLQGELRRIEADSTVRVEIGLDHLPISPGICSLDLGLRSGPEIGIDYIRDALRVEIVPTENTSVNVMQFANEGVRLAGSWSWQHLPRSDRSGPVIL